MRNVDLILRYAELTPANISRETLIVVSASILVRQKVLDAKRSSFGPLGSLVALFALMLVTGCGGSASSLGDPMAVGLAESPSSSSSSSSSAMTDPPAVDAGSDADQDAGSTVVAVDAGSVVPEASTEQTDAAATVDPSLYAPYLPSVEAYVRSLQAIPSMGTVRVAVVTGTSSYEVSTSQAVVPTLGVAPSNLLTVTLSDDGSNMAAVATNLGAFQPNLIVSFAGSSFATLMANVDLTPAVQPVAMLSPWETAGGSVCPPPSDGSAIIRFVPCQ